MTQAGVVVESCLGAKRYLLKLWQFEMFTRFNGRQTFEDIVNQAHAVQSGEITGMGLFNFYRWLYDENLILCRSESIFELVTDEVEEQGSRVLVPFSSRARRHPRVRQALMISAAIVCSLSAIQFIFFAAPSSDPPVTSSSIESVGILKALDEGSSLASSERFAQPASVKKRILAAPVVEDALPVIPTIANPLQ